MRRTLISSLVLLLLSSVLANGQAWPKVKAERFTFQFKYGASETFSTFIRSVSGEPIYRLVCTNAHGSEKLPDEENSGDIWTGDIDCHLQALAGDDRKYVSLLVAESDPSPSAGRGVFLAYMLRGNCANYPDWGVARVFRLRHMRLTLSLSEIVFQNYAEDGQSNGFKRAKLVVRVEPDPKALSRLALPARYRFPRILNPYESDFNKYRVDCSHPRLER